LSLTASQQQAVTSQSPAINLIAGAGSGKTHTVVQRIKHLILNRGVRPEEILCITFTRRAANELKTRLAKEIGNAARRIWASTFHGIGYAMLSQWGGELGYDVNPNRITIITPEESEELLRQVVQMYEWKGTKVTLAAARNALAHREEFPADMDIGRIIRQYWAWLKESNAVDYDLILLEVNRLFRECTRARDHYYNKFRHVFVDEYQDTDRTQFNLHELIAPENLFVVGDFDQSIFSWRGADLKIILGFADQHKNAETILLEECFRCREQIVLAANRLIEHNTQRIPKILRAIKPDGLAERKAGGVEAVSHLLSEDEDWCLGDPAEVAVIGRTHAELMNVESACAGLDVPTFRVGAETDAVQARTEWKIFHAALRMAFNRRDSLAFRLWGRHWLGIGDCEMVELNKLAAKSGESLVQVWQGLHGSAILDRLAAKESAVESLRVWGDSLSPAAVEPIANYLNANGGDRMSPADWLLWVSTKDGHSELEKGRPGKITLLTAHAAKGLEWNNVVVIGFNEKDFPKQRAIREGQLEEERRLAYVAFTRARERLAVFHSKTPSRFYEEAGL